MANLAWVGKVWSQDPHVESVSRVPKPAAGEGTGLRLGGFILTETKVCSYQQLDCLWSFTSYTSSNSSHRGWNKDRGQNPGQTRHQQDSREKDSTCTKEVYRLGGLSTHLMPNCNENTRGDVSGGQKQTSRKRNLTSKLTWNRLKTFRDKFIFFLPAAKMSILVMFPHHLQLQTI